ncbi:hypothetical protein ABZP36_005319 [Zizania latifolia]
MEAGNTVANAPAPAQQPYGRSMSPQSSRVPLSCSQPPPVRPVPVGNTSSSSPTTTVVLSPCAACKVLRRRCADGCVLAPYFPPTEPAKFTTAHRVFGASNIIKLLQDLPESARADAVSSMVYEAEARLRDPVYGCAGAVCRLQKEANELKVQLARAQADLLNAQAQHANLVALVCVELAHHRRDQQLQPPSPPLHPADGGGVSFVAAYHQPLYDSDLDSAAWDDQLWT